MEKKLPIAPIDKLMRVSGSERISEDAAEEMAVILEDIAKEISARAAALAEHAKRKTVKERDVKMAIKDVWG